MKKDEEEKGVNDNVTFDRSRDREEDDDAIKTNNIEKLI